MSSSSAPKIARDVRLLRADIQTAVRSFASFHKRLIGEELRRQGRKVHDLVVWYWREEDQGRRVVWAEQLVHAVDLLKEDLQVAKQDDAFPRGTRQFEHLYRQAESIGRQAGGIRRDLKRHPKGQDARQQRPSAACPDTEYPCRPSGVNP